MSQILNFDATNIFNISNNKLVQGVKVETMQVHNDEYKDKYIKILEEEVERLKKMIKP